MQPWQDAPFPLRVGEAASAYRLGGLVTAAEADNRTITRRAVLHFVGLLVFLPLLAGILVRLGGTSWLPVLAALATVAVAVHLADQFGPRPGVTLYLFERGAVLDRLRRGQVQPLGWPQMAPYLRHQRVRHLGGRWVLTIDSGGRPLFTCTGAEAVRVTDVMSAIELGRVRSVLATGATVDYGVMRVGRQGLHFPGLTVPWAQVPRLRVGWSRTLRVRAGALVPVRLPRAQLPHQRALGMLAEQLAAGPA